jgi:hypothetical protein
VLGRHFEPFGIFGRQRPASSEYKQDH